MISFTDFLPNAHVRKYEKGQILLYQGQKSLDIFQVKSGYIKIYDVTAQGREKLLMILGAGDVFPIVWKFKGGSTIHYFYETYDESVIVASSKREFIGAVDESHDLAKAMLQYYLDRTKELMSRLETIEATSAKHKVVQVLLYLADAHGKETAAGKREISLYVTHQAIADMAGVTRETASIQLKELEDDKLISYTDKDIVVSIKRIEKFLDTE